MEERKLQENIREDKQAFKKFVVLLVIAGAVGAAVGVGFLRTAEKQKIVADILLAGLDVIAPFTDIAIAVFLFLWYMFVLRRCRKQYTLWDGENEEELDGIEEKLTWGAMATNIAMILTFFFFAAGLNSLQLDNPSLDFPIMRIIAVFAGMILAMAAVTILQRDIVNLTKEINPEKQGSVYDMRFTKTWMSSFDEAELHQTYQAGFHAFQIGGVTCLGLFLFCFFGLLTWNFGMLPLTMVILIWLVQIISYGVEAIRISGKKGKSGAGKNKAL